MSRAAVSKSRAGDKGGKAPASQTPVVSHEIVPGKFTDHDWNLMVEKDGADDFVEDIVEELIGGTIDKCYELYIQKQLHPFTITQAKDAILGIIEWQFLARDEGESYSGAETGWIQDEEPDPAVTDCWAQGSVPKLKIYIPPSTPETIAEEEDEIPVQAEEEQKEDVKEEEPELEDKVSEVSENEEGERLKQLEEEEQKAKEEAKKNRKIKFKPYRGKMKSPGISTESLEKSEMNLLVSEFNSNLVQQEQPTTSGLINMPVSCHSILKVQAGRPPGNKDVIYDDTGNVVAVVRLNPDRLPSHRVSVSYQVVDPSVEAAQARLEAMRTGRYNAPHRGLKKKSSLKAKEQEESIDLEAVKPRAVKTPLPPPLLETMEVSPGVLVREGGRIKQGPPRYVRRMDMLSQSQNSLRPVATQITTPRLDVSDILDRHTPILRPIKDSPPLPPIIPHPPAQQKIST